MKASDYANSSPREVRQLIREGKWTLGGVTAELLTGERCAFLSH